MNETHRDELAAALTQMRAVFRGAGVPNNVAEPLFDTLRRELAAAVPAARPRLSLESAVALTDEIAALGERGAPPSVLEQAEAAVRTLASWLARERASTRWPAGSEPLRFFDPEPTATCTAGGATFRYLRHGEGLELDEVLVVDLSERMLRFFASPAGATLWPDQLAILRGGPPGAAAAPPSHAIDCIEGALATTPHEGPITPATLLELRRATRSGGDAGAWIGARETPLVLGRIATLLGPPPEQEQPGLTLCGEVGGAPFWLYGEDRLEGMPVLFVSPATPEVEAAANAFADLLFADAAIADVEQLGVIDPPGLVYGVGASGGRLLIELVHDEQPPWITR